MPARSPSQAALLDEIKQLRARVANLEFERRIPKEIIENACVMISIVRAPDFVYELVNPAFQALAPGKEFLGRRFADVWAELPDSLVDNLRDVIATGRTFHLEDTPYVIERGPGMPPETVYVSYSWIPLFDPQGKPDRVLTLAHEVTGAVHQRQKLADSIIGLRRAEEALRDSEMRYRTLFDSIDEGYCIIEVIFDENQKPVDYRFLETNKSFEKQTGLVGARGRRVRELVPGHEAYWFEIYGRVALTGRSIRFEGRAEQLGRWYDVFAYRFGAPEKRQVAVLFNDIGERKLTETALRESEERFRVLTQNLQSAVALVDETGAFTIVNSSFLDTFDLEPDADILNVNSRDWSAWQVFSEDGVLLEADEHPVRRAALSCTPVKNQLVAVKSPSSPNLKWLLISAEPLLDAQGKLLRLICTYYDITERKRSEETLRQSLERLERVLDTQTVGVMFWDLNSGRLVDANDTFLRLMGYSRAEVENRELTWQILTPPEYIDVSRAEVEKSLATGRVGPYEKEYFCKDGTRRWLLFAGSSLGNNQCVEFCVDISDRKRAEEALRESEARERARSAELAGILDAAPVALFIARDPECRDVVGSRMAYEMLRLPTRANASKSAPDREEPGTFRAMRAGREIPPEELPAQRAASTGQAVRNYEFDAVYEDGARRNLLGSAVPLFDETGRPRGAVGAFVDITENKHTEERLRQAQKLESVGLLAGGIAHDFNNLLTGVMGNASLLLEDAAPERAELLRAIIAGAERAAHLTRQLLAYSGKGQFIVRELDVTQAVNETADLVQFSIPKSADLRLDLQRRLPPVAMDPGQLQQILMNLVINAGEAIGDGNPGRITITTSMADVESPFTDELGEEIAPGRYVCIEVRDTGGGIDPEKKAKIFDPFFTTKFVGRGLGLAAIAGILRSQKGGIMVESVLGQGSAFRVFLPAAGRAPGTVETPASQDGRPVILVVDDEMGVRDFISAVLRRMGYQVVQASDGQEALAVCGSAPGAIGAAIVDVIMPNMSANDLLLALKAKQPGIRILLTSGYSEAEVRRLCAAHPGAAFIQKPYTAQQLARAVDELVVAPAS